VARSAEAEALEIETLDAWTEFLASEDHRLDISASCPDLLFCAI